MKDHLDAPRPWRTVHIVLTPYCLTIVLTSLTRILGVKCIVTGVGEREMEVNLPTAGQGEEEREDQPGEARHDLNCPGREVRRYY